jgi:SynChlorMet cassette protein ScmD
MADAAKKPLASDFIVLREEFDDWALLFNPDTGHAFGVNPTSVFIWKCFDGKHTAADIVAKLKENCESVPAEVEEHVNSFINEVVEKGLATLN